MAGTWLSEITACSARKLFSDIEEPRTPPILDTTKQQSDLNIPVRLQSQLHLAWMGARLDGIWSSSSWRISTDKSIVALALRPCLTWALEEQHSSKGWEEDTVNSMELLSRHVSAGESGSSSSLRALTKKVCKNGNTCWRIYYCSSQRCRGCQESLFSISLQVYRCKGEALVTPFKIMHPYCVWFILHLECPSNSQNIVLCAC